MPATKASIEDLQTEITTTIGHLGKVREDAASEVDRLALDAQIRDLASKWLELDAIRAATVPSTELKKAADTLDKIDTEIEKVRDDIQQIAKVIHLAAQAVGVIEQVLKVAAVI